MINTTIENATDTSDVIHAKTENHLDQIERAARVALNNARRLEELGDDVDIDEAASFVVGTTIAANVLNRNSTESSGAAAYIAAALKTVDTWQR